MISDYDFKLKIKTMIYNYGFKPKIKTVVGDYGFNNLKKFQNHGYQP